MNTSFCPDAGVTATKQAAFTANISPTLKANIEGLKAIFNRSNAEILEDLVRFATTQLPEDRVAAFGEAARAYAAKMAAE